MTVPNAPEGPGPQPDELPTPADAVVDPSTWAVPVDADGTDRMREIRREVLVAVALIVGSALAGLLFGALWHAFAPRVPLYSDGSAVYLRDPEGEQQIAGDGVFALIGACFGVVTAIVAYLLARRRGGTGLGTPLGLVLGGLAAGWVAWQLGVHLDPTSIVKIAESTPKNVTFSRPLQLGAKTALVAWPMAALLALLAATTLFTPRDEDHRAQAR